MIKCCYKCEERHPACHSHCERYLAESAEDRARKSEYRKQEAVRYALDGDRIRAIKKIKREGRKHR